MFDTPFDTLRTQRTCLYVHLDDENTTISGENPTRQEVGAFLYTHETVTQLL